MKIAIDTGVLFLGSDGEGEYLSFVQVTEVPGSALTFRNDDVNGRGSNRSFSKNRAHHTAFHPQRRAVCRGRKRTGYECNQRSDFDFAMSVTNFSTPSERVGPASTELTVTPVPAVVSARPRASATCMVFVTP